MSGHEQLVFDDDHFGPDTGASIAGAGAGGSGSGGSAGSQLLRPALRNAESQASVRSTATTAVSLTAAHAQGVTPQEYDVADSPNTASASRSTSTSPRRSTLQSRTQSHTQSHTASLTQSRNPSTAASVGATADKLAELESVGYLSSDEEDDVDRDDDIPEDETALQEQVRIQRWLARKKHFLILSRAGKPVYSRWGHSSLVAGYVGIFQAILGFYGDTTTTAGAGAESGVADELRTFSGDGVRFAFLVTRHLIYVAITRRDEPDAALRSQLELLHQQILSVLTASQLDRIFTRAGSNYDLRRVLAGNEAALDHLCDSLVHTDLCVLFGGAMRVLRIRQTYRRAIESVLAEVRTPNVLYAMLCHDGVLVTVMRPKQHSLYPSDLRLLLQTVYRPGVRQAGDEHWIPICLPKFNSSGFLHCYTRYLPPTTTAAAAAAAASTAAKPRTPTTASTIGSAATHASSTSMGSSSAAGGGSGSGSGSGGLAIVLVSADREAFSELQACASAAVERLSRKTSTGLGVGVGSVASGSGAGVVLLREVERAARTTPTCAEVGVPQLRHFVYRSRDRVQLFSSAILAQSASTSASASVSASASASTPAGSADAAAKRHREGVRQSWKAYSAIYRHLLASASSSTSGSTSSSIPGSSSSPNSGGGGSGGTASGPKIQACTYTNGYRAIAWQTSSFDVYAIARVEDCGTEGLIAAANVIHGFAVRCANRLFLGDGCVF